MAEKEYINREPNCKNCIHDGVCYMQEVCNDIDEQLRDFGCDDFKSTADVVEVVRCKDCKYYMGENYCIHDFALNLLRPNDFCSYGEKRDGDKQ